LADFGDWVQVEPFSSLKGTGKPKVLSILNQWCHPQWFIEQQAEQDKE
jgi:GTP-binding protein